LPASPDGEDYSTPASGAFCLRLWAWGWWFFSTLFAA
jgi:hypothetical protein